MEFEELIYSEDTKKISLTSTRLQDIEVRLPKETKQVKFWHLRARVLGA